MKIILKITLFFILFNIATFFIASTGFFGAEGAFYGDSIGDLELEDEANLANAGDIFFTMASNSGDALGVSLPVLGEAKTFAGLVLLLLGVGAVMTIATRQAVFVAIPIAGILMFNMYANSKTLLDKILTTGNFPFQSNYLILMVGISMLFMFVIYLIDIPSGQKSSN